MKRHCKTEKKEDETDIDEILKRTKEYREQAYKWSYQAQIISVVALVISFISLLIRVLVI